MHKKIDQVFCALLALGTVGHVFGTLKFFDFGTGIFVWSLSGALACALLVALNVLRNSRASDHSVRVIALVGNLCWMAVVGLFGISLGNILDPRVLFHGLATVGLIFFCLRGEKV